MTGIARDDLMVSVCIPAYNCENTIQQTFDSIKDQTYSNIEILVGNNASTDGTGRIVQQFAQERDVQYFVNEPGLFGEDNFNILASRAKGSLVAIYHSDDVYHPEIVEKCVDIFKRYDRVGVVFTMAKVIDENSTVIGHYHLPKELKAGQSYNFDDIFSVLLKYTNSFLVCPSAMFRKEVFDKFGGWDITGYYSAADLNFWLLALKEYDIYIIDEELLSYRISSQQGSQAVIRDRVEPWSYFTVMNEYTDLIAKHENRYYFDAAKIKDMTVRAVNYSTIGETQESMRLIKESFKLFVKNFNKLWCSFVVLGCLVILLGLCIINLFPFKYVRNFYKRCVWSLIFLKKKLISY